MDETGAERQVTPEMVEAIAALGNRTRLELLRALAVAHRAADRREPLTFSELHARVDVGSSSQFSYHLDKLVGRFVSEGPDGYRLTSSGRALVRAILSGVYERPDCFDPVPVDGVCVFCETDTLVATREHDEFVVNCTACEETLVTNYFPRSQAQGRTPAGTVESFGHRIWSASIHLRGGVCPECYGRIDTALDSHRRDGRTLYTHHCRCRVCQFSIQAPVEVAAALHPATISLLWSQDVSLFSIPLWEFFEFLVGDWFATDVISEAPLELSCSVTAGEESLTFLIDDSLHPSLLDER